MDPSKKCRYRSMLFVPATHSERIPKALATGTDAVIVDLEDAIAPELKSSARTHMQQFLHQHPLIPVWVRINGPETDFYAHDLKLCQTLPNICGLIIPKTEYKSHIEYSAQYVQRPIIAMIESAKGLIGLAAIAQAQGLHQLTFGGLDLSLELGCHLSTQGEATIMGTVRTQLLLHSVLNQLAPPLETVFANIHDLEGLNRRVQLAAEMGMQGMLCIHPKQITPVHKQFMPSAKRLAWAQSILDYAQISGQSVFQLNGEMIDAPVIEQARRLLQHL